MKKYHIVTARSLQEMEDLVNDKLKDGYRLHGSVLVLTVDEREYTDTMGVLQRTFSYQYIQQMTYY